jgi:hypothetical protein
VNIYALNVWSGNFIQQTLLNIKTLIGPDIIIVFYLSTIYSSIDHPDQPPPRKRNAELNCSIDQVDLTGISKHSIQ